MKTQTRNKKASMNDNELLVFKPMIFANNSCAEPLRNLVVDTYPGTELKTKTACKSLLTEVSVICNLYAVSLFMSHDTRVQLLEQDN